MKKKCLLSVLIIIVICSGVIPIHAAESGSDISIIFSNDMHSHFDTETINTNGVTTQKGGFAKIKTVADGIVSEYPNTFIFDAGDFAMGTPYQTIYSTEAPELRLMGLIGYDATTLGNHEFDYRGPGLADMLTAAAGSGDKLPLILMANIDWVRTLADTDRVENAVLVKTALDLYKYSDHYTMIEKGGVKIAIFGILGKEADSYAPESGLYFLDPIETAKKVVKTIKADGGADLIVCLSHSGTSDDPKESEDELLAKAVPEIDLIISGHSHTKLDMPIIHGNTIIASSGEYTYNLGHLLLTKNGESYRVKDYKLIAIDGSVADNAEMLLEIEKYKTLVNEGYMKQFGYEFDDVLAASDFAFTPIEDFGDVQGEDTLGNLISDSYIYAVKRAEGDAYEKIDVAVLPAGVVRGSFGEGEITAADAFNVSSLGIGADGIPGYPLVSLYLTGAELKTMAEVDISISEIMSPARLYISGLTYTYNPNRLFLNRVTDVKLVTETGIEEIDDSALYRIVGGLYSCQMLGTVENKSFGLLSIIPKDKNGEPITDFEQHIIYTDGNELKEWVALAEYLKSFDKENGIAKISSYYSELQGRKIESDSTHIADLLKNPNKIFFIALAVVFVLIFIITIIMVLTVKAVRRRKKKTFTTKN